MYMSESINPCQAPQTQIKKGAIIYFFRSKLSEDIISDAIGRAGREESDDQRTPLLVIKLFRTDR